jgi:hypothetical protein
MATYRRFGPVVVLLSIVLLGLLIVWVTLRVLPVGAQGATLTVNSAGDGADSNGTDGVCNDGAGNCTLRAAIMQTNATTGLNTIAFNIPGAGPHTIRPSSPLPIITERVVIDGFTQPGASRTTSSGPLPAINAVMKIELEGSGAGPAATGLRISGGNSQVRGMVINRFAGEAILLESPGLTLIEENFIGTDIAGTVGLGNGVGIVVISPSNFIGSARGGSGNLISGNQKHGVFLKGNSAFQNLVQGNLIGADASGGSPLGNAGSGVAIDGGGNNSLVFNTIAFNGGAGVQVQQGIGNGIQLNSIFSNNSLGIDLGGDGVTPNDIGDGDLGANNLQNFPRLDTVITDSVSAFVIRGVLSSTPNTDFRVEFFSSPTCDSSNHGEGKTFLFSDPVTTNGTGDGIFSTTGPPWLVTPGHFVTATAGGPHGTSEFSQCRIVTQGGNVKGSITLQGRTQAFPPDRGHAIARVTVDPSGISVDVTRDGSFGGFAGLIVPAGTLTFTASAPGYVSVERTIVVTGGSSVTMPSVQLRCGLVNNDNFVNINDITATVASFGKTLANRVDAQGRFVDQNGDGFVNINDITCVVSGFGTTSPEPWP